jgi:hypothetical protein
MAKLTDFIPQADIDGYLEGDDEVVKAKVDLAQDGVDYAKSIAPVDTGYYRDHIEVQRRGFNDPKAAIIEYGTEDNPAFAIRAKTENHFNEAP